MSEDSLEARAARGAGKKESETEKPSRADNLAMIPFGDNVEIYPETRLPQYDVGVNKAYKALGKNKPCYALVCEKHLVPRHKATSVYKAIVNPHVVHLVKNGAVFWPSENRDRYVFIYEDVPGKLLFTKGNKEALGWKQDKVMSVILNPMVDILQDFRNKDFVHGNIRLSNMFRDYQSNGVENFVLGDCLSTPGTYMQPCLYEPIERAMAQPIARGPAAGPDDMYALGVSLAIAMRSNDPLQELSDAAIIRRKIERGSYATITGNDRFRGSILELLRGLLHDDPGQRWTIDEVVAWMDGQRLSPKQAVKRKRAARPLTLGDGKFVLLSPLAFAMGENEASETVRVVEDGSLDQWLSRSMEADETLERVHKAIRAAAEFGQGNDYSSRLVANVSMALDPVAPIRFKDLRLSGGGIGTALAETMALGKDVNPLVKILSQNIAMNWITIQRGNNIDIGALISRFDSCRNFLRQNKIGYGVERCLYLLCPECPCLSEKFKNYYVGSPEELMFAFEDLCRKGQASALFLDRHSAAFLSVKDSKVIDGYLYELNADENYKKILANLKCLATIQKRSVMEGFPAIAKEFLKVLPAVYERYHDRNIREKLEKNIEIFAKSGSLVKMAGLLDNTDVTNKDMGAFRAAIQEYKDLQREYNNLEFRLQDKRNFGRTVGREFAAAVSAFMAFLIIVFTFIMFLTDHSIF